MSKPLFPNYSHHAMSVLFNKALFSSSLIKFYFGETDCVDFQQLHPIFPCQIGLHSYCFESCDEAKAWSRNRSTSVIVCLCFCE